MGKHATVRAIDKGDAPDVLRIAQARGLPPEWTWPKDKHGAVAEVAGRVVAFACMAECPYGLLVDELWDEPSPDGHRGLAALAREIEAVAQRLANDRKSPLSVGGVVRLDNPRHLAALRRRGYTEQAVVLSKTFDPQEHA